MMLLRLARARPSMCFFSLAAGAKSGLANLLYECARWYGRSAVGNAYYDVHFGYYGSPDDVCVDLLRTAQGRARRPVGKEGCDEGEYKGREFPGWKRSLRHHQSKLLIERNCEQLLHLKQTIHYTNTPYSESLIRYRSGLHCIEVIQTYQFPFQKLILQPTYSRTFRQQSPTLQPLHNGLRRLEIRFLPTAYEANQRALWPKERKITISRWWRCLLRRRRLLWG
ncbi:hypothetical protein BDV96DRAFT_92132 [Lophiotrema nucula]|uniref:Uncharacterized protein n=1 Tax=Lophiotrema nucula TaxID=690887 RepID=A0A6A5Z7N0_9PLEO|nr:hypothetical protein BDV96DRAFT_92132 [Lophiotrema nucula]